MPTTTCIDRHADHHVHQWFRLYRSLSLCATIANPKVEVKAGDDPFMDLVFMVYQVKYITEIVDAKLQVGTGLRDGAFASARHWANSGNGITSTRGEARAPAITCKLEAEGRCEHASF